MQKIVTIGFSIMLVLVTVGCFGSDEEPVMHNSGNPPQQEPAPQTQEEPLAPLNTNQVQATEAVREESVTVRFAASMGGRSFEEERLVIKSATTGMTRLTVDGKPVTLTITSYATSPEGIEIDSQSLSSVTTPIPSGDEQVSHQPPENARSLLIMLEGTKDDPATVYVFSLTDGDWYEGLLWGDALQVRPRGLGSGGVLSFKLTGGKVQ